jgi:hypothetical protein
MLFGQVKKHGQVLIGKRIINPDEMATFGVALPDDFTCAFCEPCVLLPTGASECNEEMTVSHVLDLFTRTVTRSRKRLRLVDDDMAGDLGDGHFMTSKAADGTTYEINQIMTATKSGESYPVQIASIHRSGRVMVRSIKSFEELKADAVEEGVDYDLLDMEDGDWAFTDEKQQELSKRDISGEWPGEKPRYQFFVKKSELTYTSEYVEWANARKIKETQTKFGRNIFTLLSTIDLLNGGPNLKEVLPSRTTGLLPDKLVLSKLSEVYDGTCSRCNQPRSLSYVINGEFEIGCECAAYLAILIEVQNELRTIRSLSKERGSEESMLQIHNKIKKLLNDFAPIRHGQYSLRSDKVLQLLGRDTLEIPDEECPACQGTQMSYLCDDVGGPCLECSV